MEAVVYLTQPVNENGAHLARDVGSLQVMGTNKVSPLVGERERKNPITKAAVDSSSLTFVQFLTWANCFFIWRLLLTF